MPDILEFFDSFEVIISVAVFIEDEAVLLELGIIFGIDDLRNNHSYASRSESRIYERFVWRDSLICLRIMYVGAPDECFLDRNVVSVIHVNRGDVNVDICFAACCHILLDISLMYWAIPSTTTSHVCVVNMVFSIMR